MLKNLIGKGWRKIPHFVRFRLVRATQKKFTASVGAIVFNGEGKILLLDHVLRPAEGWGIPGGFINHNEQFYEAIKREVFEETNLKITEIKLFTVHTLNRHIEFLVTAHAEGKGKIKSFEIKDLKWFSPDDLPEKMSAVQRQILKEVLSKKCK